MPKTNVAQADFYLSRDRLKALGAECADNAMLQGRGPPGTHDTDLLCDTLSAIQLGAAEVRLPVFDKALFAGYGDRSPNTTPVPAGLDVFVLEGWSMGFTPAKADLENRQRRGEISSTLPLASLCDIDQRLSRFADAIYPFFDAHIGIRPQSYGHVYQWRLQQEHSLKASNGGKGLSDDGVRAFVDRYMPCYELYGDRRPSLPSLVLLFGAAREVLSVQECI